ALAPPLGSWRTTTNDDLLPPGIDYIRISNLGELASPLFVPARSGFEHEVFSGDVRETISAKNAKYAQYHGACASLWLLLVVEQAGQSSYATLSEDALSARYISRFERAFILERGKQRWHELGITVMLA
ncbi:MAG: hypothetical protein ABI742_14420, partial [Gemmatimonadota bacterium]